MCVPLRPLLITLNFLKMKKIGISLMTLMFVGMTFSSCTKDYTCTCTLTDTSGTIDPVTATATYADSKKSDAEDACELADTNGQTGLLEGFTYSCELNED